MFQNIFQMAKSAAIGLLVILPTNMFQDSTMH